MLKGFEEFQKVGKDGFDAAVKSFGEMNKGFQAIAAEVTDYSKKAFEDGFVDAADVHKRLLGQRVVLAVTNLLEAADRFGQRRDIAGLVRERFGHDERLRQKPLDAAGPGHDLFVFFAEFVDAENGDDVLQFAIALENLLDAAGDVEMSLTDYVRFENTAI